MEGVAPTLDLLLHIRSSIHEGESIRESLRRYCRETRNDELNTQVQRFFSRYQSGVGGEVIIQGRMSHQRRILFQIILRGLEGASISTSLEQIQSEIYDRCVIDLDSFAATLPIKMMIPLLLFLFPAFAILFLGPILAELFRSL